jgi:peptidoglycan hydrolase-like amidase
MRKLLIFIPFFLLAIGVALSVTPSRADELDDVTSDLAKQQKQLADLEKRQQQLAKDIASASLSLSQVSAELTGAEKELSAIEKDLDAKEDELAKWEADRDALARELYKQNRVSSLEIIFSADDLEGSARQFQYYHESLKNLSERVAQLAGQVTVFKSNRASAKELRDDLAALRSQYLASVASSQNQLSSTSSQLSSIKSSIKNLTAKQEQLILEKFAASGGSETIGESAPVSKPLPPSPFSPSWMVGTYGYPHRVGMNQYGAYGRALAGQKYVTILKAYYKGVSVGQYSVPSTIKVSGYGSVSFENNYLRGISEMPRSWPLEALKAQAVAARTYALNWIRSNPGKSICTNQNCQVYNATSDRLSCSGTYNKRWCDAVNATKGVVITYGGSPIAAYYSSTAGGYTLSTQEVWGGYRAWAVGIKDFCDPSKMTCPNGAKAFDGPNYGNSPWYHAGWGDRNRSGGYNPWMKTEEFADIFNSFLLCGVKNSSGVYELKDDCSYMQYLSPIDRGGWKMKEVRDKLADLEITPLTSLSAVVSTFVSSHQANTASVYVLGNVGPLTFSGRHFRDIFTLRAKGLWSPTYRFDIGYCASSGCTNPDYFR